MVKLLALMWISNGLVKSKNLNVGIDRSLLSRSSNALFCSSFHLKDNSFKDV
jgi:hypothetical protein